MLDSADKHLFIYVVARDFGFAPNPFHGCCSLATCKPDIRRSADLGDWVMGVGGSRLKATGRCIYLMEVTEVTTLDQYWNDERFLVKRPLRNGSSVMMVGDNIYHRTGGKVHWIQEDSHHSNPDGSANETNVKTDTRSERVLLSRRFYYFGSAAPEIDLASIGYQNVRNFRKLPLSEKCVSTFVENMVDQYERNVNRVMADPFDFARASERVDQSTGKLS
jgi:hypothetical protein